MSYDSLAELRGQIERVTYTNEENGYTVARVKVYGRTDLVTVVGSIMNPTPGEVIKARGEWTTHATYGEQFRIESYECMVPATVYGIRKYLGSGLIKGIGPVMADRIVKTFGEDTLDVIEEDIEQLMNVDGIGKKRVEMIRNAWIEQKEISSVMLFLQSHGVSSAYATKIYREYGNDSITVVQENPYRLAMDIFGIGFVTADRIASNMGYSKESEARAQAGIIYTLNELSNDGHVYYPYTELIDTCQKTLDVDRDTIIKALDALADDDRVVIEELGGLDETDEKQHGKAVYLAKFHLCETSIAFRLRAIMDTPCFVRDFDTEKAIGWVQGQLSMTLAERQVEAVRMAADSKVMIITGGPGTGKTTIIKAIIGILAALKAEIMLAAPTGRAAKRMSEATGYEAKTIHRMLEYNINETGFQRNEESPLECDVLIVDEASMIDTILMHHLLKAIPREAKLILVGDVNQLPAVGAGNVLKDIIGSGVVPVVELNEIFRQARESSIIVNAHRINQGQFPVLSKSRQKLDDFYFISRRFWSYS
jgi:exodeoxyribonuclease V alpha subunit